MPDETIDMLLNEIDIVSVIEGYVSLNPSGNHNSVGLCPFHNEKTPSFSVSSTKQFYHCFGCGAHGSAIYFLMEYNNYSFPKAVFKLINYHSKGIK